MKSAIFVKLAVSLASTLIEEGYKLSEEADFGSDTKRILDTVLESLDVLRAGGLLFQLVFGGASEDEKTHATQLLIDARQRQQERLAALGYEV